MDHIRPKRSFPRVEIEAVRELWVSDAEKFVSALKLSTLPLSRSAAFRNGSEKNMKIVS